MTEAPHPGRFFYSCYGGSMPALGEPGSAERSVPQAPGDVSVAYSRFAQLSQASCSISCTALNTSLSRR